MSRRPPRARLDALVIERGLAPDLKKARALIMTGRVLVDDRPEDKAGAKVSQAAALRLKGEQRAFVSRGGVKLNGALEGFGLEVEGRLGLDIGASTGGFTDCLLQRGARRVHAVDVGYGLLAWSLRQDPRVVCLERTNFRALQPGHLEGPIDVVVADVSFISLRLLLPCLPALLGPDADAVLMIKPQFEAAKGEVEEGGVVLDPEVRESVIMRVVNDATSQGWTVVDRADSALHGPSGNIEHFLWCRAPR